MKSKYTIAVLLLLIAACKKETTKSSSDIQGTWELVSSDGAWTGHHDYAPGNGNTFAFNGKNYSQTIKAPDTTYHYTGTFSIYTGKPCDNASEQSLIKFNDNNDFPASFSLLNGKFTIGTTQCIADGGSSTYRKIK